MRAALRVLLLAALVATAGCSGVFGDESGPSAEATTTDSGPLAPGLTADGLADAATFSDAHASNLDERSLTLQERHVQRYANGTLRWRKNQTVRVAANRTRYLLVTDVTGRPMFGDDGGRMEVFADGDRVFRAVETPNRSSANVFRTSDGDPTSPRGVPFDPTKSDELYVLLNVFDVTGSEKVERAPRPVGRIRLHSSRLELPELLASRLELDTVRNATLEAVVTPEGVVEEYRIEYEGTQGDAVVRGEATVWQEAVGETTVEAPDWLDQVGDRDGASGDSEVTGNATETGQAS
jgi:hypothetical protein